MHRTANPRHRPLKAAAAQLAAFALVAGLAGPAAAEGTIRIAEQFGVGYLPLQMMRHHELIEKHGQEQGLDIQVEWARFAGGSAMNDALLSDNIDIGSGGVGPLLVIWDRTRGNMDVKGIAAINAMPLFLTTTNPDIETIEDFSESDKIALPAVKVSIQARILQMAAEQAFGEGNHEQLDNLTVSMPHPDATAAMLSGGSEINAHLSSPPFQYQQLQNDNIRLVMSSYDVLGGPHTFNNLWAKQSFRDNNPKTYAAFMAALDEAMAMIEADPKAAAETYVTVTGSSLDPAFVEEIINDPDIEFGVVPKNTMAFAEFMHKVGAIQTMPDSWQDYFFEDIHDQPGS
jgi:NitT/TauT family transport system substrate-binding protein